MLLILFNIFLFAFNPANSHNNIEESKKDAMEAFEYLNRFRANPKKYGKNIGLNLNSVKSRKKLQWNEALAKVAQEKANDMALRNYFEHIDPDGHGINIKIHQAGYTLSKDLIKSKNSNNFESLAAGNDSGLEAIKSLIIDKGVPSLGHRKHLLGISDFWADCTDIGIGFTRSKNSNYPTYMVVIIAKHKI